MRPYSASLASTMTKIIPCSTSTDASGRPSRRCNSPPLAPMPPSRTATGMIAERILPREKRDKDAGKAIAGGEVGVGAALHGGDFEHAGEPGRRAGEKTDGQDQLADAQAHNLGGADVAAGDPRGEAEHRVIDQNVGGDGRNNA